MLKISLYLDSLKLAYHKNKLYKTLRLLIQRYTQFWFVRKSPGMISPQHFVYDFSTKVLLMLYSIDWPNLIARLSLLPGVLRNVFIEIVCWPGCDVINIEINHIFLIKPVFKSRQGHKYLEGERSLKVG